MLYVGYAIDFFKFKLFKISKNIVCLNLQNIKMNLPLQE